MIIAWRRDHGVSRGLLRYCATSPINRFAALIKMVSDNVTMDTLTQDNTPGPRSESCHRGDTDMGLNHASATFALSTKYVMSKSCFCQDAHFSYSQPTLPARSPHDILLTYMPCVAPKLMRMKTEQNIQRKSIKNSRY